MGFNDLSVLLGLSEPPRRTAPVRRVTFAGSPDAPRIREQIKRSRTPLTEGHFDVIRALRSIGPSRTGDVAKAAGLGTSVTRKRLHVLSHEGIAKAGWIRCEETGGRYYLWQLTEENQK